MKNAGWFAGVAALFGVLGCGGFLGSVIMSFPTFQGARIDTGDFQGVGAESYAWIVPVKGGVVWVDAGMDSTATALMDVTAGRKVLGVLMTHGHADHTLGVAAAGAPIYIGPGDADLLQGQRSPLSPAGGMFAALMGNAGPQENLIEVTDGQVVTLGGQRFEAVHTPGHTPGSVVWVWDRKHTAFTGDTLLGHGDHVAPVHWIFAADHQQNLNSAKFLKGRKIQRIADGHSGVHEDVGPLIEAL